MNAQGSIVTEGPRGLEIKKERAERTMGRIDRQPRAIRELANEYGWLPVNELIVIGVKSPRKIEHLITTIRERKGATPICERLKDEGIALEPAQ